MNEKILEHVVLANTPSSLTKEELELDQQLLTRSPTPQPVTAWVRWGDGNRGRRRSGPLDATSRRRSVNYSQRRTSRVVVVVRSASPVTPDDPNRSRP